MTDLATYIRRTVDAAPPLTAEQADRLALLLRPTSDGAATAPLLTRDVERQREREQEHARQRALHQARQTARDVVACDVCSAPPEAHPPGGHAWQPGRLSRVLAATVPPREDPAP